MSFTPFFGFHFFGAIGVVWLLGFRINMVAAMVGTLIGNPWTFPIFMLVSYHVGLFILSIFGFYEENTHITASLREQDGSGFATFITHNFNDLFLPTAAGGILMMIVAWPLYYWIYHYIVRGAQRARALRIKRKKRASKLSKRKKDKSQ